MEDWKRDIKFYSTLTPGFIPCHNILNDKEMIQKLKYENKELRKKVKELELKLKLNDL